MKKRIIIIGASSGIGRELARIYAADGCKVGITGRRMDLLTNLQNEFSLTSNEENPIIIESFDVTGHENIMHINALVSRLGGLDLLIYNSGYGEVSEQLDWVIDKKTVDINVNGFIQIVNWAFNYFSLQGYGHIAATSSVGSNRGNSFAPAYSASKAFMSCYMEGLYMKTKKNNIGITITDLQPGFVNTKMAKGNKQFWVVPVEKAASQIVSAIEHKRFRVYISRRWYFIAKLMRWIPLCIFRRIS
jgi:short-subunit dehydrogenase